MVEKWKAGLLAAAALLGLMLPAAANPLQEVDVVELLKAGIESAELVKTIEEQGYAGGRDTKALSRVREAGGEATLLLALRRGSSGGEPKPDAAPPTPADLRFRFVRKTEDGDEKHGFIDGTGKVVIKPVWDHADEFSEGFAVVYLWKAAEKKLSSGYIDLHGNVLVYPAYDRAGSFHEGVAVVEKGHRSRYLDTEGKFIGESDFALAKNFSEGKALVTRQMSKDAPPGYIDRQGKWLFDAPAASFEDHRFSSFSEDRAAIYVDGKCGYIDEKGKTVIEPAWDLGGPFKEGRAWVKRGDLFGCIDRTGQVVLEPVSTSSPVFSGGLAAVNRDGQSGYIDLAGKVVIPFAEGTGNPFSEGRAGVFRKTEKFPEGKWGYIDPSGKLVVEPAYERVMPFSEGRAVVTHVDKDKNWHTSVIDRSGQVIVPPKWLLIGDYVHGIAKVLRGGEHADKEATFQFGLIDRAGKLVVEPVWDEYVPSFEGLEGLEFLF